MNYVTAGELTQLTQLMQNLYRLYVPYPGPITGPYTNDEKQLAVFDSGPVIIEHL